MTMSAGLRGRRTSRPSGDDREAAILQTAERLLAERPITDISVDDLAVSLNLMNERAMLAALASEQPSVDHERVVDTLTHIWLTSIYGS